MQTNVGTPEPQDDPDADSNFYAPENAHFYATFVYPPLDRRKDEIRLLHIDRSGRGAHVLVSGVLLSHAASYAAVSYYSGDPRDTRPLLIDGIPFKAFANLCVAIDNLIAFWNRTARQTPLFLWVDQICINQSDPHEKSHQVGYMREIYQHADDVFVSMPMVSDIRHCIRWLRDPPGDIRAPYRPEPPMSAKSQIDPLALREYPMRLWDLMYDLIDHPWWQRAWVFQEFIVASRVYVVFSSDYTLDWGSLSPLLERFLSYDVDEHIEDCWLHCDLAMRQIRYMERRCCMFHSCMTWKAAWDCVTDDPSCPCLGDFLGNWNNLVYRPQQSSTDGDEGACEFWCRLSGVSLLMLLVVALWLSYHILWWFGMLVLYLVCCSLHRIPKFDRLRQPPANVDALNAHIAHVQRSDRARSTFAFVVHSKLNWAGPRKLSELMEHSRNCRTSHAKDKVYAFIGLALPGYNVVPNYGSAYTVNAVLTDAARAIITCERHLDILYDAGTAAGNRRVSRGGDMLPSWVPDWTGEETEAHRALVKAIGLPDVCKAGGDVPCMVSFRADDIGNEGRIMDVVGVHIATLAEVLRETYQPWRTFRAPFGPSDLEVSTVGFAKPGDEVWVIYGCNHPFALRRGAAGLRVILGVAAIRDGDQISSLMSGAAIDMVANGELFPDTASIG